MPFAIRALREEDSKGVATLDTWFETSRVYDVVLAPQRIELVECALATPIRKRYPVESAFAPWASWDTAWVAHDGEAIVGFAAVELEDWHKRLVLHHIHVAGGRRREGIARALLDQLEANGRERGAAIVWLETSNVNLPAIEMYTRRGYALCGADRAMYAGTDLAHESAVFYAKPLSAS